MSAEARAAALAKIAEGVAELVAAVQAPVAVPEQDELLTVPAAARVLDLKLRATYAFIEAHPQVKRLAGSRIRVSRLALLRATKAR